MSKKVGYLHLSFPNNYLGNYSKHAQHIRNNYYKILPFMVVYALLRKYTQRIKKIIIKHYHLW
jgi:hypothetical protein